MTIKKRLILSYILVFIIPIFLTLTLLGVAAGGFWLFIQSGNHAYVESATQFNYMSQGLHHFIFRSLKAKGDDPEHYKWVAEIISPEQVYIRLDKDNAPLYEYGNSRFAGMLADIPAPISKPERQKDNVYSRNEGGQHYYLEEQIIQGHTYRLYFVSKQLPHGSDEAIEHASQFTIAALLAAAILILIATIYFLTRFVLRYIQRPLHLLRTGSDHVRDGNLTQRLHYEENDEIRPVVEAFNLMTTELDRSLKDRTRQEENRKELIASLSHDIRTPLTAIKAYIEGLADNVANTPERQAHYIAVIQKKTEDMDRMINQLFLFSKIDLGERALPMEPLELTSLISQIVDENDVSWKGHQGSVTLTLSDTPLLTQGNPELWRRIVTNLVNNSIKYKTSDSVHITICTESRDGRAVLTVIDDGPGVPKEMLPRLAEPFFRTDKARSRTGDGSGLGLAIVARGLHLMNGSIRFSLASPHGLCVTLDVPLAKEDMK